MILQLLEATGIAASIAISAYCLYHWFRLMQEALDWPMILPRSRKSQIHERLGRGQ